MCAEKYESIVACEDHPLGRRLAGDHTYAGGLVAIERYAADGSLCLLLDLLLCLGGAVPVGEDESTLLDLHLELLVGVHGTGERLTMGESFLVDILLNVLKKVLAVGSYALEGGGMLLECVAAHHLDDTVLDVACSDGQTHGHTLELIVGELEAGTLVVGIVELHAHAEATELVDDRIDHLGYLVALVVVLVDGHDDYLDGCEMRGRTRPLSSECVMINAPIRRVDTPQDVAHTYSG